MITRIKDSVDVVFYLRCIIGNLLLFMFMKFIQASARSQFCLHCNFIDYITVNEG